METTNNLQLPYILPSQAQKHVTHNEALTMLDALVQLSVLDRNQTGPTGMEEDGDRFIVAPGAIGPWAGWEGDIAYRLDGSWQRLTPQIGWLAWVADEDALVSWNGTAWVDIQSTLKTLQNLTLLGLGTVADSINPFAAKLNKALWTARYTSEGGTGDLRYTLNKEGASHVASLLMQSNWSGRAELGLIGDDDFGISVSPDGSTWKQAVGVDSASGSVRFPQNPALNATASLIGTAGSFIRFTGLNSAAMQPLVGSVSQSGGVPTGAVIETGSGANGRYVRWADGTQICTHSVTVNTNVATAVASVGIYRSGIQTWTFPAAFFSAATTAISGSTFQAAGLSAEVQTATNGRWYFQNVASEATASDRLAKLMAIGRWY